MELPDSVRAIGAQLETGDGIAAASRDRRFYDWDWPLMAPAPAN